MNEEEREYSQPIFHQLRQSFFAVGKIFLLSRFWCALWVYAGHANHPFREKIPGGYEGVSSWILNPWTTYDSAFFLAVAARGYDAMTAPFFPLYPLLLRVAAPDENAMALLAIVVSNVAFLLALMLLYLLARREDDAENKVQSSETRVSQGRAFCESRARLAVFLMAFSPLSCVFSAVYTESFYAFLLLAAFCCARGVFPFASTRAWCLAGFFAALAALTRNSGIVVFAALLCQWFLARRANAQFESRERGNAGKEKRKVLPEDSRFKFLARTFDSSSLGVRTGGELPRITLFYACLPLLAFVAWQAAQVEHFGGFAAVTGQANYGRVAMFPWMPILLDMRDVIFGNGLEPTTLLGLLAVLSALWMGVRELRRRAPDAILVLGVLLMQLTLPRDVAPYTNTALRLMSSNFPFWTMWARRLNNRLGPRARVLAVAFYLLAGALMSYLFGLKTFVSG